MQNKILMVVYIAKELSWGKPQQTQTPFNKDWSEELWKVKADILEWKKEKREEARLTQLVY